MSARGALTNSPTGVTYGGKARASCAARSARDEARAGRMKDEADRIGAGFDRGLDVGLPRDAADLDPRPLVHGESTRAAP